MMDKSLSKRLSLKMHLYTLRMDEGTSLCDHLAEFTSILNDLDSLGVKVENEDQALLLLRSLPASYKTFRDMMVCSGENVTLECVKSNLQTELHLDNEMAHVEKASQGVSLVANREWSKDRNPENSRVRSRYFRKNLMCHYCKKEGHLITYCFKLKNGQKIDTLYVFKAMLDNLTPQNNSGELFELVKVLNIDTSGKLHGIVSLIYEKALMEPTFCEMYANFFLQLSHALPDVSENNKRITFKRLLVNKCQEEFERGEHEEAEAEKTEVGGEVKQTQDQEERVEKRVTAGRRKLGNIRLIGELYKKRMLTERIMHECIKKLLGQSGSPSEEDIEALCTLMSTIGETIDHPRVKEHMDGYFAIISNLSTNQKYSSRIRLMLEDAIDLRKNNWQQQWKVEEVDRDDAGLERQAQATRLAPGGPLMNNSSPMRMRWIPRRGSTSRPFSPMSNQQDGLVASSPGSTSGAS